MISKLGVKFSQGYLYSHSARNFRDRYANAKNSFTKRMGLCADHG
jgi:hypothetical protein